MAKLTRMGLGMLVGILALAAALSARGAHFGATLQLFGVLGTLAMTAGLTVAAFPFRILARAARAALEPRPVNAFDLERALHVLIFTGTALVGAGFLYGVVGLVRAALAHQGLGRADFWSRPMLLAVVAPVVYAIGLRLIVIEPLKASLRSRLVRARVACGRTHAEAPLGS